MDKQINVRIENSDIFDSKMPKQFQKNLKKYQKKFQWFSFDLLKGTILEAVDYNGKYIKI